MASAVLASRNEPCWGEPKVYVRRYPNTTTATTVAAESNNNNDNNNNTFFKCKPNPNPNPNKQTRARDPSCNVHVKEIPFPAFICGLASSKRKLSRSNEAKETSNAGHVSYNLGACTRRELKDLKKRLLLDLERVRILQARIENSSFDALPICPAIHRPSLPPPPPVQLSCTATNPQIPSTNRTPRGRQKGRGSKRANPFGNPKAKRAATNTSADNAMKRCGQMLTKLMKDKHGWVFNAPVDVVLLRLDDYHEVIKKPMDLGTVKSNLKMNFYKSPREFADDVRLTFNNALKYNPKGDDVYVMAETLLGKFNQMFDKMFQQQQRISAALAKPKSRVMSLDEKRVLGRSLVELPQEKMVELLGIMKKKNYDFGCHGEEIELDIGRLDNDTLWELDMFVDNYMKMMGKSKTEQEPLCGQVEVPVAADVESEMMVIERSKKMDVVGDEDVDIGEEIPVQNYSPVVIERDVSCSCSSSSSSDSSSSSNGSGSGSSSESESDDDSVQSPFVEPKDAPRD